MFEAAKAAELQALRKRSSAAKVYVRALIPDCYNRRKFKPHYSSRMYLIEQNNRTMRKVHNGRIARLPFRQVVTQILDNTAIPVATVNSF